MATKIYRQTIMESKETVTMYSHKNTWWLHVTCKFPQNDFLNKNTNNKQVLGFADFTDCLTSFYAEVGFLILCCRTIKKDRVS